MSFVSKPGAPRLIGTKAAQVLVTEQVKRVRQAATEKSKPATQPEQPEQTKR